MRFLLRIERKNKRNRVFLHKRESFELNRKQKEMKFTVFLFYIV